MEIDFLRHFGFSKQHVSVLRDTYGDSLLPLQEKTITEGKLFDRENLLVCSPTSSGKTFLAEVLFLFHALNGRNAVLLVPTKALANQSYEQLKTRYSPLGYDVLLSSRDHPFDDRRIMEGRFHLAIIIYEKMRSLMAVNDSFVSSLGACIVDEIHYLYHAGRGPDLELILTELRKVATMQILGLSATLSGQPVADWLNARMVVENQRPIELRQGVWCRGRFTYREFNSKKEGIERFPEFDTDDDGEAMLDAACQFAALKETTLLFWPLRNHCYAAAKKLAKRFQPETFLDVDELNHFEFTTMRDFLTSILSRRIAVHTSDLTPEERNLVERLAQAGEIMLICATSTLAEGINFPVVNVLTTKRMYASNPNNRQTGSPPSQQLIPQDRLCNMIGRAGRLGYSSYGRGIVVTTSPGDVEGLLSMYIDSARPDMQPVLNRLPLHEVLLRSVGGRESFTRESCIEFLSDTLSGRMGLLNDRFSTELEATFQPLIIDGFITDEMERYYLSTIGKLVVRNGLSAYSAKQLDRFIERYGMESPFDLEILFLINRLPEMKENYVPVSRSEILSHAWSRTLSLLAQDMGLLPNGPIRDLLTSPEKLRDEHHTALKKTILYISWIQGESIPALEKRFGIFSGAIQRLGEEGSWLIGCLFEIAAAREIDKSWLDRLITLQKQVLYGLPANVLDWAPFLRRKDLSRERVLALCNAGFNSPTLIRDEDRERLSLMVPEDVLDKILKIDRKESANATSMQFSIEIDSGRADRITVDGKSVYLTPMQTRLLLCLAKSPGKTVDYETLFNDVWFDGIGDRKKLFRHKKELLKKIHDSLGIECSSMIESVAGTGLVLNAEIHRV